MKHMRVWGPVMVLFLLAAGFFYRTIFSGKLPVPTDTLIGLYHPWRDLYASEYPRGVPFKNFLITDPVRQQIPWRKLAVDAWKRGERPGWNPYAFAGVPLDANIQAAAYYPLNALFVPFDFPAAWTMLIALQPLLAGLWMYWYLRRLGMSAAAGLLGSIAWAYGGFSVSWMTWGTIMHTALWLPLMLLSVDALISSGRTGSDRIRWSVLLGGAAVMTMLGGHMQISWYVLGCAVAYAVFRVYEQNADRAAIMRFAGIGIVVVCITAVQWVPFVRMLSDSGRIGASDAWKTDGWFLPWQHAVQFISPDFFGNPATMNYWGTWNYGEFIGYVGIIPLVFAASAVSAAGISGFFTLILAVGLFFMLPHPLTGFLYRIHIPVFSVLQPTRLMVLVDFSLAMLAAFGLDSVLRGKTDRLRRSVLWTGCALAAAWGAALGIRYLGRDMTAVAHFDIARRNLVVPTVFFSASAALAYLLRFVRRGGRTVVWIGILLCVTCIDLFRFGWKFTPFTPAAYFFPETETIRFLERQQKPFRVMSLDDRLLPPNVSAYYGIESVEGYDPVVPAQYERFLAASERGKADISQPIGFNRIYTAHNIDSPILPYLNVRYVLALTDVSRPFLREVFREGETRVYEYTKGLPRAYLSSAPVMERKQSDILDTLFAGSARTGDVYWGSARLLPVPVGANESVRIDAYGVSSIRMTVAAENTRLLVVLHRFDSRWQVTIDGKAGDLVPTDYLFTGIVVPSGTHDIIMTYR